MANRERGERTIVVGDRVFTLRLTCDACCDVEDQSGRSLEALVSSVNRGSLSALRWMLWACLQDHHRSIFPSPDDVGTVIDTLGVPVLVRHIAEFLVANLDETGDEDAATDTTEKPAPVTWRQRYIDARLYGLTGQEFWQLSLLELRREQAVARERMRLDWNRDVTLAWHVAALNNQRRLPALDRMLQTAGKAASNKPQTWQEMKAALKAATQAPAEPESAGRHVRKTRKE